MVRDRLAESDCDNGWLLDGFPRTTGQAEDLDSLLRDEGTPLDLVLELSVPEELLIERLLGRGRSDDARETIHERFLQFEAQTRPVLDHYQKQGRLHSICGTGTPDEVFGRILAAISEHASG
jgi:adenylate kinase